MPKNKKNKDWIFGQDRKKVKLKIVTKNKGGIDPVYNTNEIQIKLWDLPGMAYNLMPVPYNLDKEICAIDNRDGDWNNKYNNLLKCKGPIYSCDKKECKQFSVENYDYGKMNSYVSNYSQMSNTRITGDWYMVEILIKI